MEFAYHWKDKTGEHFTLDRDEADEALHKGNFIELVMIDKRHKDGSNRIGM